MAGITTAQRRVKDDVNAWISEAMVRDVCTAVEHVWRRRVLTPTVTLRQYGVHLPWKG